MKYKFAKNIEILLILAVIAVIVVIVVIYLFAKTGKTGITMGSANLIGWEYKDKCPLKGSGDPLVFGPLIWPALHVIAENYPENPNEQYKLHCYNFLKGLPYMLPCPYCGNHLLNEEIATDKQKGDNLEENLKKATQSRENLRDFFVDAHNNVDKHNNKKQWTNKEVEDYYKEIPACIYNDTSWFTLPEGEEKKNSYEFNF